MKKLAFLCAGALALAGMQSAAYATTIRPAGLSTVSGIMTIAGVGTCSVTGTISVPEASPDLHPGTIPYAHPSPAGLSHGHSAAVTAMTVSGAGLCSSGQFVGFPYAVSLTGSSLKIAGAHLISPIGTVCMGDFSGTYAHPTTINYSGAPFGSCVISTGSLNITIDIDTTP